MTIDVVIVTKDRPTDLLQAVTSITSGKQLPQNLIIIDNGSDHSSMQKIVKQANNHQIPIIYKIIKPLGLGYARNLGLKLSNSQVTAYLDDDQIAPPEWLTNFSKKYKRDFQKFAAIGGARKAYYKNNYWNHAWEVIENNRKKDQTYFISTGNSFINQAFIKRYQIKINQNFTNGAEDISLCEEIIKNGGKIYQDSSIFVLDKFRKTGREFAIQWFQYGQNLPIYYETYRQQPKRKLNYLVFPIKHLIEAHKHLKIKVAKKHSVIAALLIRSLSFTSGFLYFYFHKYKNQLFKSPTQKTVLFLFDDYHVGGVTTLGKQYIQAIKPEFTTITLAFQGNMNDAHQYLGSDFFYQIPKQMRGGLLNRIYDTLVFISYLNQVYQKHHVDIMHFSTLWSATYALMHPKTWFLKKIITFHGAHHLEHESRSYQSNPKPLIRLSKLFIHKYIQMVGLTASSKIIVLSQYSKQLLTIDFSKKLTPKIEIIPGYVNSPTSKKTYQPSKHLNIINIGRAEPRKGIDNLLKAVKILADKGLPVTLKLASPVEYYEGSRLLFLYQKLGLFEKVHFLHSSNQNNLNLYNQADVFVIPSKKLETFGMTILESMRQGIPVIGTPIGGIVEILEKVHPNLISKDTTPQSIADALTWFYHLSIDQKKHLSVKGLEIVKTVYSPKIITQQIIDVYRSIL